ncbi:MAG: hypothetical protein IJP74_02515 [Prevotella sp.]|nr:hypothetical protein [Prevotella sp.]
MSSRTSFSRRPCDRRETADGSRLTMTCRECGRELPVEAFELYHTGTRRRVCRQCKYLLYGVEAKRRWKLRQLAKHYAAMFKR